MKENYLLQTLTAYFGEILILNSKLQLNLSFLNGAKEQFLKDPTPNRTLFSAIETYRDLTLMGAKANLFTPDFSYEVYKNELDRVVQEINSQNCCFRVAQSYEIFETYFLSLLTEYMFHNQEDEVIQKIMKPTHPLTKTEIRKWMRSQKDKNNKGLFSIVRKISSHFRSYEANNIYLVNICEWFDLVSMIRHVLVHNRQEVSEIFLEYIDNKRQNEMFNRHFKRKKVDNRICIWLEKDITSDIIGWLNSLAHFLFKSLSEEKNMDSNIPQYNPYKKFYEQK